MILKLANEKVEIQRMEVPELIKETSIHYVFESNTEHLHPVLTIGEVSYKNNHIIIEIPVYNSHVIDITVTLYDDNEHIIHIYHGQLEYNEYQITGTKPVRPDFEKYIQSLEFKILSLEEEMRVLVIKHKKEIEALTLGYEQRIKELEEKGEIV
jgi:hypothetical protein